MTAKHTTIALVLAAFLTMPLLVGATAVVGASKDNTAWQQAVSLGLNPTNAALYGRLNGTGDARYYSLRVTQATVYTVTVETTNDAPLVEPRVVIYEPEFFTIGPALPMPQPPLTLAAVYPANAKTSHVEGPLRTTLVTRVDKTISFPKAGRYYVAVYNAGHQGSPYRLTLATTSHDQWPMSAKLRTWWLTNMWLGPQYGALTIPLFVAVAAILAWLVVSKIPHPIHAGKPLRAKRTVKRHRVS